MAAFLKKRYGMDILCTARLQFYIAYKKIWSTTNGPQSRTSAVNLAHRIHGPNPTRDTVPIFILHGLLGSKRNWESMCKNITAFTNRTVVAVDARNHGDSPHHASHTYFDLAVDLSTLITAFSVERGIIIGHSMGGRTGMALALTEPSKVASLIVVDVSPVSAQGNLSDFFPMLMEVMQSVDFTGMDTLSKAKTAAKNRILESGIADNMDFVSFILMNIGKLPDKSFGWKCNLDALQKNADVVTSFPKFDGREYKGPTLFLGGKLSNYLPPEDITGIRELFPTANLQVIEGAGHNVHTEQPIAFFDAVVQFLSTVAKKRNGMDILYTLRPQRYIAYKKKWTTANITQSRTSAIDLAHRIHGPSPTPDTVPIFVLHGFLGSKRNWESMCKKMTAFTNRTVVAVDARNHGDSPHHASHTYFDLAVDLSKLITKFSVEKGIIIGHSMGGRTGMTLALTEPSKVASLIVVDISPISTSGSLTDFFPKLMEIMQSVDFTGMYTLNKAKTAAKNKIAESGITNDMDSMHFVLMNIGKLSDKSFGWKCNLDALQKNFDSVASFPKFEGKEYKGPTLFLGGKLSYYLPPEDITGIRELFPTANLHYIKGAGHNVHAEDPNAFFNAVMQFLSYTALSQAQM